MPTFKQLLILTLANALRLLIKDDEEKMNALDLLGLTELVMVDGVWVEKDRFVEICHNLTKHYNQLFRAVQEDMAKECRLEALLAELNS